MKARDEDVKWIRGVFGDAFDIEERLVTGPDLILTRKLCVVLKQPRPDGSIYSTTFIELGPSGLLTEKDKLAILDYIGKVEKKFGARDSSMDLLQKWGKDIRTRKYRETKTIKEGDKKVEAVFDGQGNRVG